MERIQPIQKAGDPYLIKSNQVGKLVLGGYLKEIFWNYPENRIGKVFIHDGSNIYSQYEILSSDLKEVLFTVEPDCRSGDSLCIIKRIEVYAQNFHTAENTRVGMLYQDIINSGQVIESIRWYRGSLIARTRGNSMNYILGTSGIPKSWFTNMDPHMVPFSTPIISIVLTGQDFEGFTFRRYDSLMGATYYSHRGSAGNGNELKNKNTLNQTSTPVVVSKRISELDPILSGTVLVKNSSLEKANLPSIFIRYHAPLIQTRISSSSPFLAQKSGIIPSITSDPKPKSPITLNKTSPLPTKPVIQDKKPQATITATYGNGAKTNSSPPTSEISTSNQNQALVSGKTPSIHSDQVSSKPLSGQDSRKLTEERSLISNSINSNLRDSKESENKDQIGIPAQKKNYIIASPGESIFTVSERYNLSVSEIFDYNPFLIQRKMKAGDKIIIGILDNPSSQVYAIDPYHTKGPVSKVYLQTKDLSFGNIPSGSAQDSINLRRSHSIPPKN